MDGSPKQSEKMISLNSCTVAADPYRSPCDAVRPVGSAGGSTFLDISTGFSEDMFLSWKKETVSTICKELSGPQRSAFLFVSRFCNQLIIDIQ